MGPTIQRGVIQHPLQKSQSDVGEPMSRNVLHSRKGQQSSSILPGQEQGRVRQAPRAQQDRMGTLPGNEVYLNCDDHVIDSVRGCRSFPLNEVARPVFVNHYYAGESVAMNRRLIRLEDCDVSVENSVSNQQAQGSNSAREIR